MLERTLDDKISLVDQIPLTQTMRARAPRCSSKWRV